MQHPPKGNVFIHVLAYSMGIGNIKLAVNDATATIPKYKHRKSFKDQLHRLQTT